jgi:hypothetical protein
MATLIDSYFGEHAGRLRAPAVRFGWQVVAEVPLEISAWNEKTAVDVPRQARKASLQQRRSRRRRSERQAGPLQ